MNLKERSFGRRAAALAALSIGALGVVPHAALASGKPPVISPTPTLTAYVGQPFSYTPTIKDPEGDKLEVRLFNVPSRSKIDRPTGRLTGAPPAVTSHKWLAYKGYDGAGSSTGPQFTNNVVKPTMNTAPVIPGTPATTVAVNRTYSFQPSASDANGDKLTFSVTNKPARTTFSTSTGQLSDTPTASHVGIDGNVSISASDGRSVATLAPFLIAVVPSSNGSATLRWITPTTNTDGTALTNLGGFRIYYGTSSNNLT
jgi:hypothetical protein